MTVMTETMADEKWAKEIRAELIKQPFYHNETQFKESVVELDKVEMEFRLRKMRLERDFFKKILTEKYREKHPGSYRYVDARVRIEILNRNGKLLKQLING